MIRYAQGNLLEAKVDVLVNSVNMVGIMGKGIALMFKEAFPENFQEYAEASKHGEVQVGHIFVTERRQILGPKWIVNFPTKKHWRNPSKLEWIVEGLKDLRRFIEEKQIRSIALPPLGAGNGGLDWRAVRERIEAELGSLRDVDVIVYEPTREYQNVAKRTGVEKLTPARALIAELIRRYWVLGIECTLLEIQKLAWFLGRCIEKSGLPDPLDLGFEANRYGPCSDRLEHLLNALDGSYLHCEKRIRDAGPMETIWFDDARRDRVQAFLTSPEAKIYRDALDATSKLIDGFQSPLGMELLATVDWVIHREDAQPTLGSVKEGIARWPAGNKAAERKLKLFDDRTLALALERLTELEAA